MSGSKGRPRRSAASKVPYPIEELLQDVRDLRLTLAADLRAAAAATEEGATQVASDIVAADREELANFRRVAEMRMGRLQPLAAAEDVEAPRWRRRVAVTLPAVPLVGAMALSAAAVTGVLPLPDHHTQPPVVAETPSSSPVAASLQELQAIVDDTGASAHDVIAAARALHRQLAALIAGTSNDPAQAAEVAELLRMEQDMVLRAQPPGASVVLDATRRLAAQLVKTTTPLPSPTSTTLPTPLATTSPKSTKTSSPTASPKQSSTAKPSSSTSSSPSSSSGSSQIPAVP